MVIVIEFGMVKFILEIGPHGILDGRINGERPKYLAGPTRVTDVGFVQVDGFRLEALARPNSGGILDV